MRISRQIGVKSQNDFFAQSGGLIKTQDVLLTMMWRVLKITWADGRDMAVCFFFLIIIIITVLGRLNKYPSVEPFCCRCSCCRF